VPHPFPQFGKGCGAPTGCGTPNGQNNAGDERPGVLDDASEDQRLILRRRIPARPRTPLPNISRVLGSGVGESNVAETFVFAKPAKLEMLV